MKHERKKRLPLAEFLQKKKLIRFRREVSRKLGERESLLLRALQEARKRARLTQEEVGRAFGRDQSFVAKIESGVREVTFAEVEMLAGLYGLRLADFWIELPLVSRHVLQPEKTHGSRDS